MNILILGGTGFLGPQIVEAAMARGHTITLFNRGKTHKNLFPNVEKLQGDRAKDDYASLAGRKWDAAVDTSANVPAWMRESCKVLVGNVRQYVFTSSISVYPINSFQKPGKDETAPVEQLPPGADERQFAMELYGAHKAKCEEIVMQAFPGHATVIRPGLIVGPGDYSDRFTYWPVRIDRGGEVLAPGSPDSPVQFIDARDLGQWIVQVVEDGHVGIYNATGPRTPLSMAEMLYGIKAITTSDPHFAWVDERFLAEHEVGAWMEMPLWIPQEPDSMGFSQVSNEKAVSHGLKFRSLADIATATLDYARTRPADHKWKAGLRAEKEAAVLKAWHEHKGTSPATAPTTSPSRA
ncbi:MAG: NAD-dependent epimerase/dehydratase family protein [Tepidisphaeraceae bacterium]